MYPRMSEGNPRDFQGSPTPALMECHDTESMMVEYRFKKYRAYEKFGYPPPPNPIPSTVSATYTQPRKTFGRPCKLRQPLSQQDDFRYHYGILGAVSEIVDVRECNHSRSAM